MAVFSVLWSKITNTNQARLCNCYGCGFEFWQYEAVDAKYCPRCFEAKVARKLLAVRVALPAPNWALAESWARWWAVGADDYAIWFACEPFVINGEWNVPNNNLDQWLTRWKHDHKVNLPLGIDWRLTKQQRPR